MHANRLLNIFVLNDAGASHEDSHKSTRVKFTLSCLPVLLPQPTRRLHQVSISCPSRIGNRSSVGLSSVELSRIRRYRARKSARMKPERQCEFFVFFNSFTRLRP